MIHRAALAVAHQITLAYISDIARFFILREEVIERLIARRTHVLGDRLIPFFAIGKNGIDIEDHAAKIEQAVADDLADTKAAAGLSRGIYGAARLARKEVRTFHRSENMALRTCKTSGLAESAPDMPAFCCTFVLVRGLASRMV